MSRPTDARPDDAAFRVRVETFALIRRVLPIGVLAGSLAGPLFLVDSSAAVWLSMALFFGTVFVLWTLQGLPLYPAHTFGIEYRFEDERFEADPRRCVRCETAIDDGTHRRYARQFVVLGVPVHTLAWGDNDFCPDCLDVDPNGASDSEPEEDRESVPGSTVGGDDESANPRKGADPAGDTAHGQQHDAEPGTDIVRRVDLHDDTTALEVARAFDDE
ncbi:hypothetical protein [Natronorubrum sp. FCH18a]|uniref:hypothetical protein n=1 Tax=Natronorubrum sp. FCH18a TaxID=3447018 RepID=UPI003F51A4D7